MHPSSLQTADAFEHHRARLFGIAYRMLGSVADAEDVLQEVYLRWHHADPEAVRSAEAWLVAVTTRLAIDALRRASRERDRYVGQWLPEPVATGTPAAPADARGELAADLSMAFLVLLERLSPEERAALLLHDVFGAPYDEVARVLEKSEAACRQLVHRARLRVRDDGRRRNTVPIEAKEQLAQRFVASLAAGDEAALLALVAPDAPWIADGGGKVPVARNLRGAARIVQFLLRLARKAPATRRLVWINGEPAIATYAGGRLFSTVSLDTDGERVLAFYAVVNPEKLARLTAAEG
ncbi:MAG TPA: RNA polymerase sigma factor SigJ [Anaeromyxobacteraceae bacterium]|nr:RNA polymerase sigma factor SigJ [Anaeromyxobacteraceae bacterium]